MKKQLKDICAGFVRNIALKDLSANNGEYPIYGASGYIKGIDYYVSDKPYIGIVKDGSGVGRVNSYPAYSSLLGTMQYIAPNEDINLNFLMYALRALRLETFCSGAAIPHIYFRDYQKLYIDVPEESEQKRIADELDGIENAIATKEKQIAELDELVKSKFIEMFGSLETNDKGWQVRGFNEFATIDGVMTTEYEKYADYPHIGIDSIEKGTGELKGWRTVKQDNVISGKYLFTPEHIIYSKIRPNLNKVALPDFDGLCSADAYPILVNKKNCNRYFLACVLRSEYFLSYILAFSARANMPKVNRQQIAGFSMPLPPLKLQEEFAEFYKKTDKAKGVIRKQIADLQELLEKKMDEYFN